MSAGDDESGYGWASVIGGLHGFDAHAHERWATGEDQRQDFECVVYPAWVLHRTHQSGLMARN